MRECLLMINPLTRGNHAYICAQAFVYIYPIIYSIINSLNYAHITYLFILSRTPEEKEADRLKRKKANEKNTEYKRINKAATHFNGPRAIRR